MVYSDILNLLTFIGFEEFLSLPSGISFNENRCRSLERKLKRGNNQDTIL